MKTLNQLLLCFVPLLLAVATRSAEIRGTVRNSQTGAFLEAVEISLPGSPAVARTDREGRFVLSNLAPGDYRLRVVYPGSREETIAVNVADANSTATVEASLRPVDDDREVVQLSAFVVAGEREGYAASVARQKAADNIQNVLSMDTYGAVADGNIGTFLQRVAGVSAIKDIDIAWVSLRGTPAGATAVTLDGTRFAGVEGDRSARIDQMPSEFIKEIEVVKANTPDMSADALAGTINLVTKSAFDYRSPVRTYQGGASVNTFRDDLWRWLPFGSFTYLTTFGAERRVGLSLSASYNKTIQVSDWAQTERRELDARMSQARNLDDILYRERDGLSAKLEVNLNANTRFNIIGQTNYWKQVSDRLNYTVGAAGGVRRPADYSRRSRALIESGQAPLDANGLAAGLAPGYTENYTELLNAVFTNQVQRGGGISKIYKFGIGGEHTFGSGLKLSAEINHSHNRTTGGNSGFTATLRGIGMAIDTRESLLTPKFTQTYGPSIAYGSDLSLYTAVLHKNISEVREDMDFARVDGTKDLGLAVPVTLKAGAAYRSQDRWTFSWAPTWAFVGADNIAGRNAATGVNDDNLAQFLAPTPSYGLFNGKYPGRDKFDYGRVFATFNSTPGLFRANAIPYPAAPGLVNEKVYSGYVMAKAKTGELLTTAGARVETTELAASGILSDPQNPTQTSVRKEGSYSRVFPSVHFKYRVAPNFLARASYTTSAQRPGIGDITPTTTVNYSAASGSGTVTQNNPNLKPQFAQNYDLMLEYYFKSSGLISAGVFRKDIKDFIVSTTGFVGEGPGNGFDGRYAGFNLNTNTNAPTAKVQGLEFDYNQPLAFLPAPFNRLRLFGNYTFLKTEGRYSGGADELVNFVPRTYNVGASMPWRRLEGRVSYNYKDGFLVVYSTDPTAMNRNTPDRSLDVGLKYKIREELSLYVDVVNLLNPGTYWYNINRSRVVKYQLTGVRLTCGFSGRF